MEWYRYDKNTGEYLYPVMCQRDPLNPDQLFPVEQAIAEKPLPLKEDFTCIHQKGSWVYEEDHRGKTIYSKKDKTETEVEGLGPIPETHTKQQPGEFDKWDEARQIWIHDHELEGQTKTELERSWAMSELALTDRCLTPDFPITDEGRTQITNYRSLLRNPARSNHPHFPNEDWRPTWPKNVKRPAG